MVKDRLPQGINFDHWEVSTSQVEESIRVYPVKGFVGVRGCSKYVSPPNWIERKLGITFQIKIKNAIRDTQSLCDKWNKEIDKAAIQMQIINDEVIE